MSALNKKYYWIWLAGIKDIKYKTKIALLNIFTIQELYNGTFLKNVNLNSEYFIKNEITEDTIFNLTDEKYKKNLEYNVKTLEKMDINIITYRDKEYPDNLKQIYDYPISIFYKGNIEILKGKCIAIVGSRIATNYGLLVANKISSELSNKNLIIVSGGARGIDTAAHMATIKNKKSTILVKGSSLEYIYPPENKYIEEQILQNNGLILSEYLVGTKPSKYTFPERNRIISGISRGVIVVEASQKSGALITADLALEYNREVFAVPGNITSKTSSGTNLLIKQGAKVVTTLQDILEEI